MQLNAAATKLIELMDVCDEVWVDGFWEAFDHPSLADGLSNIDNWVFIDLNERHELRLNANDIATIEESQPGVFTLVSCGHRHIIDCYELVRLTSLPGSEEADY